MTKKFQAHPTEVELFAKRTRFYNDVVGVLSFSFAIAALGTQAPRFYAFASAFFLIVAMSRHGAQYERIYELWRELRHPLTQTLVVWRCFIVFILGWTTLGAVAAGFLTTQGLMGFA